MALLTKRVGLSAHLKQPDNSAGTCQPQKEGNSAKRKSSWVPGGLQIPKLITLCSLCFVIAQHCWNRAVALIKRSAKPFGKWAPMAVFSVMGVRKGKRHSRENSSHLQDGCGDPGGPDVMSHELPQERACTWLGGYSKDDVARLQRSDSDLSRVTGWLRNSTERSNHDMAAAESPATCNLWLSWDQLVLHQGMLYKKWQSTDKVQSAMKLVVPKTLQKLVLKTSHDTTLGGHLGLKKAYSKMQKNFYWHRMKESVRDWVFKCPTCGAIKNPRKKPPAAVKDCRVGDSYGSCGH